AKTSSGSSSAASLTGTSTATANLPLSARLLLVQTIDKFLDACDSSSFISLADTAPQDLECPTWFMRSAFSSVSDQEAFDHFLRLSVQGSSDVDQDASGSASRLFASSIRSSAYSCEGDSLLDAYSQGRSSAWGVGHLQGSLLRTSEMLPHGEQLPDAPCEGTGKQPSRTHHSHAIPSRDSVLASALAPIFLNAILDSAPSLFSPDPIQSAATMASSEAVLDVHGQMFLTMIKATLKLWRSLAGASTGSSGFAATSIDTHDRQPLKQFQSITLQVPRTESVSIHCRTSSHEDQHQRTGLELIKNLMVNNLPLHTRRILRIFEACSPSQISESLIHWSVVLEAFPTSQKAASTRRSVTSGSETFTDHIYETSTRLEGLDTIER
ncbi:rRNA processing protein, partial [Tilletia horrida]